MHPFFILISVVIILKRTHGYQATGILVTEEGKAILHLLFQVTEAYHIAAILHGIEDAVGAAESLQQAVHLQVLVHPKGVQCLGIEAGQEHAYHDEDIQFLVLHAQGNVLVVVGKALGIHTIGCAEHLVIIVDGTCQKFLAHFVQSVSAFRVFVFQSTDTVTFRLIGSIGKYRSDAKLFVFGLIGLQHGKLVIIQLGLLGTVHRKDGVEALGGYLRAFLFHLLLACLGHFHHILRHAHLVALATLRFAGKVVEDVCHVVGNVSVVFQQLFRVDAPYLVILYPITSAHSAHIVNLELQHVLVVDGIDDGVAM